jgi:hypothetical protein
MNRFLCTAAVCCATSTLSGQFTSAQVWVIGEPSVLIGAPTFYFCGGPPFTYWDVTVWGFKPESEVTAVDFSVHFQGEVEVLSRQIATVGMVDASPPGDDIWELQFPECSDQRKSL